MACGLLAGIAATRIWHRFLVAPPATYRTAVGQRSPSVLTMWRGLAGTCSQCYVREVEFGEPRTGRGLEDGDEIALARAEAAGAARAAAAARERGRVDGDGWSTSCGASSRRRRPSRRVQVYVSQLRKRSAPGVLETRPPGYVLRLEAGELDLRPLRAPARARPARCWRPAPPARPRDVLREALALWRGPAAGGLPLRAVRARRDRPARGAAAGRARAAVEADLRSAATPRWSAELEALVARAPAARAAARAADARALPRRAAGGRARRLPGRARRARRGARARAGRRAAAAGAADPRPGRDPAAPAAPAPSAPRAAGCRLH